MLFFGYSIGETFAINNSEEFLKIASLSPALEKGIVNKDPILRIRFTEELDENCVKPYNFIIKKGNFRIPAKIAYNNEKKTISIAPNEELSKDTNYSLHINMDIYSKDNRRMKENYTQNFVIE